MDQQHLWDAADDRAFREKLRLKRRLADEAREKESAARSAYALAITARKRAEQEIHDLLAADSMPLPLFDRPRSADPPPVQAPAPVEERPTTPSPATGTIASLPLEVLDSQLRDLWDKALMPAAKLFESEMARRAAADPRGVPLSALGIMDVVERSIFKQHEIATVGELVDYLDESGLSDE